jgi:hypothetical protein
VSPDDLKALKSDIIADCRSLVANRYVSVIQDLYSPHAQIFDEATHWNGQDWIDALRAFSQDTIARKDDRTLISPAYFDSQRSRDTHRGNANVVSLFGVWLDNDGGDLTHTRFREIFSELTLACMNTFSGGSRYRVFIPTSSPMSVEADQLIKADLFHRMALAGFTADGDQRHGFDVSKLTPCSLFYWPCSVDGQANFFISQSATELDPLAYLDDMDWSSPHVEAVIDSWIQKQAPSVDVFADMGQRLAAGSDDKARSADQVRLKCLGVPQGGMNEQLPRMVSGLRKGGHSSAEIRLILEPAIRQRGGNVVKHLADLRRLASKVENGRF